MKISSFYKPFIEKFFSRGFLEVICIEGRRYVFIHLSVLVNLVISLFFAFLPLMISAAVKASGNNESLSEKLSSLIFSDVMFVYCSSFIAPFFIMSFKNAFLKKKVGGGMSDFLLLIPVLYVLLLGALMYSGVVARNLFSLGDSVSSMSFPTKADLSIVFATLIVWYYCIFKDSYIPNNAMSNFSNGDKKTLQEFDKEMGE